MKRISITLVALVLLSSCVSKKKYVALETENGQIKSELTKTTGKYVPLLVKIAPDMTDQDCVNLAETLLEQGIDGVIATNTTVTRDQVETLQHSNENKKDLKAAWMLKFYNMT